MSELPATPARESLREYSKSLAGASPGGHLPIVGSRLLEGAAAIIGAPEALLWGSTRDFAGPPLVTSPSPLPAARLRAARAAIRAVASGRPALKRHVAVALIDGAAGQSAFIFLRRPSRPFSPAERRLLERLRPLLIAGLSAALAAEQNRQLAPAADPSRAALDLLAALAHDMRTPLASIKGYATAILNEARPWNEGNVRQALEIIDYETTTLTTLISDLLEAAVIDNGRLTLQLEPVLLNRVLQRLVADFARQNPRHRFEVAFPEPWPIIHVDPQRVEQVSRNILDNAVKYSPRGGLILVRGDVTPAEAIVHVSDEGIGIAPEDLNRLFEKFFRARRGVRVAGSGLGLPIARAIVEEHGGRIWAESTVGQGTTLHVALPRRRRGGRGR